MAHVRAVPVQLVLLGVGLDMLVELPEGERNVPGAQRRYSQAVHDRLRDEVAVPAGQQLVQRGVFMRTCKIIFIKPDEDNATYA